MIQIRHVPEAVHRKLKARAATKGMSLSDYLIQEITPLADLPTMDEFAGNGWRNSGARDTPGTRSRHDS